MEVKDPGNLLIPFDKVKELVHDKLVKTLDLRADVNSDVLRALELFFLELEMQLYVDDIWNPDWRLDYLEGVIDFVEEAKLVTKKQAQWLRQYHDWIVGNDDMFGDVEDYRANSRSFYFDVEQSPLLIAHSQQELEKLILSTNEDAARRNCKALRDWYGINETGRATDTVCDFIISKLRPVVR